MPTAKKNLFNFYFWFVWWILIERVVLDRGRFCVTVMASHLGAYVCALYARNMSGEPKNEIGGRQYQTKPDQQEF